jgi:hypothetical protein
VPESKEPSHTLIPTASNTLIGVLPTNPPTYTQENRFTSKWIICDENITTTPNTFTWIGPYAGTCTISLSQGEFVVGTADRFGKDANNEASDTRCVAFALLGPITYKITINHSGGGVYTTPPQVYAAEVNLKEKQTELDNHPECNKTVRGYDIWICDANGCQIIPP